MKRGSQKEDGRRCQDEKERKKGGAVPEAKENDKTYGVWNWTRTPDRSCSQPTLRRRGPLRQARLFVGNAFCVDGVVVEVVETKVVVKGKVRVY